jgi:stage II sporulation protein D
VGPIVNGVLSKLASARAWRGPDPHRTDSARPDSARPDPGRVARARAARAILVAAVVLTLTTPTALASTTYAAACDSVNLRSGAGTTYAIKKAISSGTQVTVVATVSGGSWSATCAGKAVSGSSWYRISAVSGKSVSSLYGVTYVYGATGLFKVVPAPTPSPSPTVAPDPSGSPGPSGQPGPTPLADTVTFYGRGYGHGVGLSQYGAYGRALAGQDYLTILKHYYQGTTYSTTTNREARVLVLPGFTATTTTPLRLYGRGGSWTIDGIAKTFPADAMLRLIPTGTTGAMTWRLLVTSSTGSSLLDRATTGNLRMRPASSTTVLQLYSKPTAYDRYRGVLHLRASTTTGNTTVVNELPLETYLRGVVPAEVSYAWPTAVLRAQAVAARSYAAIRLHPATGTFDLYDDTRSQVYRGVLAEHSTTNNAITATALGVLRYGTGAVANTLYHSAGGGATESNQNVFNSATGAITTSPVSYLQGSLDRAPDGTAYDKASPYATWTTATYTLAQVQAIFAADARTNVGTLVALDLTDRGVARLISVTLIGADGTTKTVSGGVFVSVFNAGRPTTDAPMRDSLFDLAPIP